MSSKRCSKCAADKPLDDFYRNAAQPSGRHNQCIACFKESVATHQAKPYVKARRAMQSKARDALRTDRAFNPEQRIKWSYYISIAERDEILAVQGGACAICRSTTPGGRGGWHVDHDHACCAGARSCGKCVRGLLCSRCNPMIGMAKDDAEVLMRAVKYLQASRTGAVV